MKSLLSLLAVVGISSLCLAECPISTSEKEKLVCAGGQNGALYACMKNKIKKASGTDLQLQFEIKYESRLKALFKGNKEENGPDFWDIDFWPRWVDVVIDKNPTYTTSLGGAVVLRKALQECMEDCKEHLCQKQ